MADGGDEVAEGCTPRVRGEGPSRANRAGFHLLDVAAFALPRRRSDSLEDDVERRGIPGQVGIDLSLDDRTGHAARTPAWRPRRFGCATAFVTHKGRVSTGVARDTRVATVAPMSCSAIASARSSSA